MSLIFFIQHYFVVCYSTSNCLRSWSDAGRVLFDFVPHFTFVLSENMETQANFDLDLSDGELRDFLDEFNEEITQMELLAASDQFSGK